MYSLPGQDIPLHKVPVLGDVSVGKTCIVDWIEKKAFNPQTRSNVGVSTVEVNIDIGTKVIPLSLWDTAGQETYRSLVPLYTRNAEALILVFDIAEKTSFENLPSWLEYIKNKLNCHCPIFLVANKIDCDFVVTRAAMKDFADTNGIPLHYTSAKTGQGIEDLFRDIATLISSTAPKTMSSGPNLQKAQQSSGCC